MVADIIARIRSTHVPERVLGEVVQPVGDEKGRASHAAVRLRERGREAEGRVAVTARGDRQRRDNLGTGGRVLVDLARPRGGGGGGSGSGMDIVGALAATRRRRRR